jgi:hypothetical protein
MVGVTLLSFFTYITVQMSARDNVNVHDFLLCYIVEDLTIGFCNTKTSCNFKWKFINNLIYADDTILIRLLASALQQLADFCTYYEENNDF